MSDVFCPLCFLRISDWMEKSGKTESVQGKQTHKSCIEDYKLRMGLDYRVVMQKIQDARLKRDWSEGLYET